MRVLLTATVATLVTSTSTGASADEPPNVDYVADSAIAVGSTLVAYLIERLPIETKRQWGRELFGPLDNRVRRNFSRRAARVSDISLVMSLSAPLIVTFSSGFDEASGKRAIVYLQALALNLAPAAATKFYISRPRPYTYSKNTAVAELTRDETDTHRSFYSGHSALSFAAAVASSTLFTSQSDNREARMTVWGLHMALAAGTANMRVRAGKHFYSDIVVGAMVGSSIAYLIVGVHDPEGFYTPSGGELIAIAGGVALGSLLSQLVPLDKLPVADSDALPIALTPMVTDGGLGLALSGVL